MATSAAVDHDIGLLVEHIRRIGKAEADGSYTTTFGALFADDSVQNSLESLAGTLKAAKRKKIVQVRYAHAARKRHSSPARRLHSDSGNGAGGGSSSARSCCA